MLLVFRNRKPLSGCPAALARGARVVLHTAVLMHYKITVLNGGA